MALRNILVHLDSGERTAERLKLALNIAKQNDARLVGVFSQLAKAHRVGVVSNWPPEDYARAAAASKAYFETATVDLSATEWVDLNRGGEAEIIQQMTDLSRHFDLIITGQSQRDGEHLVPQDLNEQVIVDSGRPVLVVPYVGHFDLVGERPLFAWSDARAAARAFSDALALVTTTANTLVVSIAKPTETDKIAYEEHSLKLALAHLKAHGIDAKSEQLLVTEIGLMDTLLNRAADHSADLLVIGAFGGHGYPLFSRGSGSRYMLRHMTMPILFAH